MIRKLPVVPTLVVAIAAATMVVLGFWQLQRKEWKEGLLARYQAAQSLSAAVPWPVDPADYDGALYRRSRLDCDRVVANESIAGRSAEGEVGWAHVARCELDGGGAADVAYGWSREAEPAAWSGGEVAGFVAPAGEGVRLVASPPQAGLQPLAAPDPEELPNNHLSYAVQWFLFALTAVVIYALALRKRAKGNVAFE